MRRITLLLAAILSCALAAPAAATHQTPTVTVTNPTTSQTVSGTIRLNANATNAARVEYRIDGTLVAEDRTCCAWDESWDSRTRADGSHTVTARAIASDGVSTTSAPVTFTVRNAVATPTPTPTPTPSPTPGPEPGTTVKFFDGFDGPAGSLPDPAKWAVYSGTNPSHWGSECMTNRPSNIQQNGSGLLVIVARKESSTPCSYDGTGGGYTAAGMSTGSDGVLFKSLYGRVEFRAKVSCGSGTWDALWMSGATPGYSWPTDGEIDVFENLAPSAGGVTDEYGVRQTVHGATSSGGHWQIGNNYRYASRLCDGWHTYAVDWRFGKIAFIFDGIVTRTITPSNLQSGWQWPFDTHQERLLVTLSTGHSSSWGGNIDDSALPAHLYLDWVRVLQ
jgi:beta-glucanase (GH16 family)